jgi:hypothetical protein
MGNTTHLLTGTRIYRCWAGMHNRCNNPKNQNWVRYGGRGIKVCKEWDSLDRFLFDMGHPPATGGLSIDRIDNDGNYEPGNCRWASQAKQNANTCRNRFLEYQGRTQTNLEWAREYDMEPRRLYERLKRGWSMERALTTPCPKKFDEGRELQNERAKALWKRNGTRYRGVESTPAAKPKAEKAKATIVKEKVPVTELLELKAAGKGIREIARITGVPKSTVSWQLSRLG